MGWGEGENDCSYTETSGLENNMQMFVLKRNVYLQFKAVLNFKTSIQSHFF